MLQGHCGSTEYDTSIAEAHFHLPINPSSSINVLSTYFIELHLSPTLTDPKSINISINQIIRKVTTYFRTHKF